MTVKLQFKWPTALDVAVRLRVVRPRDLLGILGISVVGAVTDVFGLLMILPLLEFIQSGSDAAALAAKSRFWTGLVQAYAWIGLSVTLSTLSAAVVFFIVLRSIALSSSVMLGAHLRERITANLRGRLFGAFAAARPAAIRSMKSGSFVVVCGQHAQASGNIAGSMPPLVTTVVSIAAYGATSLSIMPGPTILVLAAAGLILLTLSRYVTAAKRLSGRLARLQEEYTHQIGQRFRGWRLLKFASAATREAEIFARFGKEMANTYLDHTRTASMIGLVVTPLAAVLVVGTLIVSVEWFAMDVARITLLTLIMVRMLPLVEALLRARQMLATVGASFERVEEIIVMLEDNREADSGMRAFPALTDGIRLQDVSMTYAGASMPAIAGLTLYLPARHLVAIAGESGAGKTTLVDIVSGLERPTSGHLSFDGVAAEEINLSDLRKHIFYIPQTPILFDGTIAQNIGYLEESASPVAIAAAAAQANAASFIEELPQGYDTQLSEDGSNLSGGQRQRIALARAFLSAAPIIILDEPTSAVDQKSEMAIREAISRLRDVAGKTVLLITHSAQAAADADRVVYLKKGRLDSVAEQQRIPAVS